MKLKKTPTAIKMDSVSLAALLQGGNDQEFRHLVHNLLAFSSRILAVRDGFGSFIGLTGGQYTILISIAHLQAELGVGANVLAEHLHLSSASVTIEVNKLVAMDLVEKKTNATDKRRIRLRITKEGRNKLEFLKSVQVQINDALFANISASEFQMLRSVVERLVSQSKLALALLEFRTSKIGTGAY